MTKEKAAEVIRNTIEPWTKAYQMWATESEKLRQTAIEGMSQTLDNTHKLAKESLAIVNTLTDTARKQFAAHIERTVDFVNTFTP